MKRINPKEKKEIRIGEIKHKLSEIEDALALIEENLPQTLNEFLHLGLVKDGIYKQLEFAIENIIDVCSILNRDMLLGIPSDEEDIVKNLETKRILSRELTEKIREIKAFRNILVHRYGKINDEIAFDALKNSLPDFQIFRREVLKIIDTGNGKR